MKKILIFALSLIMLFSFPVFADEVQTDAQAEPTETVEITKDNWEQYFEIVPIHLNWEMETQYEDVEEQYKIPMYYNGFALQLKDEYTQAYKERSGAFFNSDDVSFYELSDPQKKIMLEAAYAIYLPPLADVTCKVRITYDDDALLVEDFNRSFEILVSADWVEDHVLEREGTINDLTSANLVDEAEVELDPRQEYYKEHLACQLLRCQDGEEGVAGDDGHTLYQTEDFLKDHFKVEMEDISGSLAIWTDEVPEGAEASQTENSGEENISQTESSGADASVLGMEVEIPEEAVSEPEDDNMQAFINMISGMLLQLDENCSIKAAGDDVYVTICSDKLAECAALAKDGDETMLSLYQDMKEGIGKVSESGYTGLQLFFPEGHIQIDVLNDLDKTKKLMSFLNGECSYDVLEE